MLLLSQQIHVHKRRWTHEDLLLRQGSHRFLDFKLESSMWMKLMIKSSMWMKPMIKSSMCIKLIITINVETFRYRRGCRVQGPRKEQVVKVQKRLIFTIIGHDDGNHCNHLGVVIIGETTWKKYVCSNIWTYTAWNKHSDGTKKWFLKYLNKYWNKYLEETKKYLLKLYFNLISISTTHIHDLYQQD